MAKKIDKRKLIIPSLRLRTKAKKTERCANCLHYHNDTQVKGYGRCKLFDVRVRKNELCDSLSTFNLHREVGIESINGRRIQTLNKEQVTDLKKYKTIGRRGSKIEESRGVIEEVQYTPIVTTTDYEKGFIDRYFVQRKSNPNNPVLEVESFSNFNGKYYKQVTVEWKIKGPRRHDTYTPDGLLLEKSIYNFNRDSLKFATGIIPELKFKVTNFTFLSFQRGDDTGQIDMEDVETEVQSVYKGNKKSY
tara:strand:+ start:543 stop:1286 length:744 start_codon:yes stop_codon:yes gene_type:complete